MRFVLCVSTKLPLGALFPRLRIAVPFLVEDSFHLGLLRHEIIQLGDNVVLKVFPVQFFCREPLKLAHFGSLMYENASKTMKMGWIE